MKQQHIKTPLVFRLGIVLLCAMLCTCHLMGGLYARYISSFTGSASVQVAVFGVSCSSSDNGTSQSLEIGSSETVPYTFTVENTSEVTIEYTIEVVNLPDGVTVTGNSDTFTLGIGASQQHTLTFTATDSATVVTDQEVSVKVHASQVD